MKLPSSNLRLAAALWLLLPSPPRPAPAGPEPVTLTISPRTPLRHSGSITNVPA